MTNYKRGDAVIRKSDNQVMTVVTNDGHKAWCVIESDAGLSYTAYGEDDLSVQIDDGEQLLSRSV